MERKELNTYVTKVVIHIQIGQKFGGNTYTLQL